MATHRGHDLFTWFVQFEQTNLINRLWMGIQFVGGDWALVPVGEVQGSQEVKMTKLFVVFVVRTFVVSLPLPLVPSDTVLV